MFGLFKASDPPTFGDVIWKLILRIVIGLFLICTLPWVGIVVVAVVGQGVAWLGRLLVGG